MATPERENTRDEDAGQRYVRQLEAALANAADDRQYTIALNQAGDHAAETLETRQSMLIQASRSETQPVRLWAAVAMVNAHLIDKEVYMELSDKLASDADKEVREAILESIVYDNPRTDLSWEEMIPVMQTILTHQS